MLLRLARFFSSMLSQFLKKLVALHQHILHHAQDLYTRLLVEKRADVMRRYRQVLVGKERDYA